MGAVFNTPGTLELISLLSRVFTHNFTAASNNVALKRALADKGPTSSHGVASAHGFAPSSGNLNRRWKKWLDLLDGQIAEGNRVRDEILGALNNPGKYESIEFFAVPDSSTTIRVSFSDLLNPATGKYSLVVTARTQTIDNLPNP